MLDVPYDEEQIRVAVERCVDDADFRWQCQHCDNPYGSGNAGPRIAEILATIPIDLRLLQKKMVY